jgi:hypothetical protein
MGAAAHAAATSWHEPLTDSDTWAIDRVLSSNTKGFARVHPFDAKDHAVQTFHRDVLSVVRQAVIIIDQRMP